MHPDQTKNSLKGTSLNLLQIFYVKINNDSF